jgi:hypothetical protein
MKTLCCLALLFLAFLVPAGFAQTATPTPIATNDAATLQSAAAIQSLGLWRSTPHDSGATEWSKIRLGTNAVTGAPELQTNRYTAIGNNLNFTNDLGALEASQDVIRLMTNTGGAAALQGSMKAYFPPTLGGSGDDPITIVSPNKTIFKIRPLALYYFDAKSGKSVLLASPKQAQGELVGLNQVVYRSIFDGLSCDLRLTYTKGAFESDLVMLARPKPPEAYGLDSSFTRMELWHDVDAPVPTQTSQVLESVTDPTLRAAMAEPDFVDETLDFSDLHFPLGRAFSWNGLDEEPAPGVPAKVHIPSSGTDDDEVVVAKKWGQIGKKAALMESVRWTNIEPSLASLPLMAGGNGPSGSIQQASLTRQPPRLAKQTGKAQPMRIARAGYRAKGFVWDYTTISGSFTSYIFNSGTFFISAPATFSSTVSFGSGSVLKFANNAYLQVLSSGSLNCSGNSVLTSMHDNAFGEQIAGSTGYPTYSANPAIWIAYGNSSAQTINYMRIRWAQVGFREDAGGSFADNFNNSSLEWCQTGNANARPISLQNSTQCSLGTAVTGSYTGTLTDICNGTDPANGLPYSWEYAYFGQSGINASADPDADGLNNQQEYNSGSNPVVSDRPTVQPPNPFVTVGGNLSLSATVAGTQPPSYQWTFNGVNIAGATTSICALSNVQLANCGYYAVSANYAGGSSTSPSVFLSVATPTNGTPVPQGIVAWWPGNGNANDVIGGDNGTLFNSAGYASGEVGQAFSFTTATDYMSAPNASALNQPNALTLECWVLISSFPSGGGAFQIVSSRITMGRD